MRAMKKSVAGRPGGLWSGARVAALGALVALGISACDWGDLDDVPAGFADGVDNDTQLTAGPGLTETGGVIEADFDDTDSHSGSSDLVARGDHDHDDDYVLRAGDTMTGALVLDADPAADLGAATKQYVDAGRGQSVDGVTTAIGGDIDIVEGANVTITPDDGADTITIAVAGGAASGLDADTVDAKHAADFWQLGGNALGDPTTEFMGATASAVEIHAGARTLRLEPETAADGPNVLAGASINVIGPAVVGATISGGGDLDDGAGTPMPNRATDDYATVGGGAGNQATNVNATVAGGLANTASGANASIGGGYNNIASASYAVVAGGGSTDPANSNRATDTWCAVGGGHKNLAGSDDGDANNSEFATVGGGDTNTASGEFSTVVGGNINEATAEAATIGGGQANDAKGPWSTVGGGHINWALGSYATIPGGDLNAAAGDYSFAAGRRAQAVNQGAFVWADSTDADFASTAADQFLVRATGGVGIGTASPTEQLSVSGSAEVSASVKSPLFSALPGDGSAVTVRTNDGSTVSGGITIRTGDTASNGATTGSIVLQTGHENWTAVHSEGGQLTLYGYPSSNQGGPVAMRGGDSWANAGAVTIRGGNSGSGKGGDLTLKGGGGGSGLGGGGSVVVDSGAGGSQVPGIVSLRVDGTEHMRVHSDGNVGVGTTAPATALDVIGTVTATGLANPTDAAANPVLTTDAVGNASWQVMAAGSPAWGLSGNAGTTPGTDFLGTTDDVALEIHVNATRALRLVPETNGPSILGGHPDNHIEPGADSATVSGGGATGEPNRVYDSFGTVGGGRWNQAGDDDGGTGTQMYGTVGGGYGNYAMNTGATVAGGITNFASGNYAAVPGGHENTAAGELSFAAGRRAKANHAGAFVWGDSTAADVTSTGIDSFTVRAAGGATFYSDAAMTSGVELPAGGGAWAALSDRNAKENFRDEDAESVLTKLAAIPMQSWNYRAQDRSIRHLGPVAQDFFEAFGLGGSEKRISTVDADGVALAAIKALEKRTRELREENADLRKANITLEQRVMRMERALAMETRE